jgi:RNA polymerase sigma-70 factor (ECF subfamily)
VPEEPTTVAIQRYLDALPGDPAAEPVIRELLERAACRLRLLCAALIYQSYPRLARPPVNRGADELPGGAVAGLLAALRTTRPRTVRRFLALANQHMRWQLNDLASRSLTAHGSHGTNLRGSMGPGGPRPALSPASPAPL